MQQRVVVAALAGDSGGVGLMISVEDVTPRLEMERQLARQLRHADPAVRAAASARLSHLDPIGGFEALADAISDEDWRVRRDAVKALATKRDEALVAAMVGALRDGHRNFSLLSSAIQLLTMTGVDPTDALTHLLQDPDADLRIQATLALGAHHNERSTAALLAVLRDPDPNVRFHAIEALGKLAPREALEPLVAIAESGDFFLAFPAIEAAVRIDDAAVAKRIAGLLPNPLLALPVAEALARTGDQDAVVPLVNALAIADAPLGAIVSALAAIHRRYDEWLGGGKPIETLVRGAITPLIVDRLLDALPGASGAELRDFIGVLSWLDAEVVDRSVAALAGRADLHPSVFEILVRLRSSAVDLLTAQLERDDLDVQRAAVDALGRAGDRRALPALVALLGPENRDLWIHVAAALARIGDDAAYEPLMRLIGDADAAVRHAAVGALNSIGHPDMAARVGTLLHSEDPLIRESAVRIAGYFGYPETVETLLASCADPVEAVRAAAVEQLPVVEHPRAHEIVTRALQIDSGRVRAAAATAIVRMDHPEAPALLERALGDEDAWVRYFAALGLGRLSGSLPLDRLRTLAATDPAPQVRVAAVEALGAASADDAVRAVTPLAAAGNLDVAAAAFGVLLRKRPSAVAPAVRDAIRALDAARRRVALTALAASDCEDAVTLLAEAARTERDDDARQAARASLGSIAERGGPQASKAAAALARLPVDPEHGRGA
jgi:HEAT repeat protein